MMNSMALLNAGCAFTVVRHGHTTPLAEGEDDLLRILSERGVGQVNRFQTGFDIMARRKNTSVGFVMSSTAKRAIDTVSKRDWPDAVLVPELYIPSTQEPVGRRIDEAFRVLRYSPLAYYYLDPTTRLAIEQWAFNTLGALERELAPHVKRLIDEKKIIMIGCHAIMSMALAIAIAQAINGIVPADARRLLTIPMEETEAIVVTVNDGWATLTYLEQNDFQMAVDPPAP
jgi:hypothetical protein